MMVFSDFQCPLCACSLGLWEDRRGTRWKGTFRVEFHHFPLSKECNDTVTRDVHPESCRAGYAAEAARLQGGEKAFWMMHDLLFKEARRLAEISNDQLARKIGLDGERLVRDMESQVIKQAVADDVALGKKLGVEATPTVVLNGRRVPAYCLHNPLFWEAIAKELPTDARLTAHIGANQVSKGPAVDLQELDP